MLCGLGFGLFQVPNNRNMFLAAPLERSGAAGGMQGTARLVGQTSGAIVITMLFAATSLDAAPRIGLGIGALFALAASLVNALRNNRFRVSATRHEGAVRASSPRPAPVDLYPPAKAPSKKL